MRIWRSLSAALAGSIGTTVVGLVAVPLFLRHLGVEAYGVVAFSATVLGLLQVLDLGLAPALSREVAQRRTRGDLAGAAPLLHSLAVVTWGLGAALGGALALAAPALSEGWLRSRDLPPGEVARAVRLIGLAVACRWPVGLYQAVLVGAERQAAASALALVASLAVNLGGVAVLALVAPTPAALLAWQAAAWLAAALAWRAAAWGVVGRRGGVRFDPGALRRVWRFSAGLTLVSAQAIAFTQLDKALLSRMLPLDQFGGYALASTVAAGLALLVTPFATVLYPRFSSLVAAGDEVGLAAQYLGSARLLAAGLFPLAMALVCFAPDVVQAWTGDATLAAAIGPVVAALAAGSALHGLMHVPYALQLAAGRLRLPIAINAFLLVAYLPLVVLLTRALGPLGAGLAWLALHALYVALGTWLTHRHLLPGLAGRFLLREAGRPLLASAAVGMAGRAAVSALGWRGWPAVGAAAALACAAAGAAVLASPELRSAAREALGRLRAAGH